MNTKRQPIHKLAAATTCAGLLVFAGGCGSSSKPAPPSSSSASSTVPATTASSSTAPSTPDPTADADTQALGVYKNMITALTAAMTTNKIDDTLPKYATGSAFVTFAQAISSDINGNIIYTGAPQSTPKVSETDLTANPKVITITDCFGSPKFIPTFWKDDQAGHKAGQSAVGPGQSVTAHPLTVKVVNRTGKWMVEEYTPNGTATC